MSEARTGHVLVVDDDEIDTESLIRSFRKRRIANPIRVARDGLEALAILRGTGDIEPMSVPYIVLLDLNMPRMNGIEFLEEIRADEELRKSVVFMLTTSDSDRDILSAYDNQVAGYIVKDRVGDDFLNVIGMLDHYWRVVELPE
ncbi:MAG: response regulator [Planctomycetaceae bacterium]